MTRVIHRSNSVEWATPSWLFRQLDAEFGFELDVAATPANAKCDRFFTAEQDGLLQEWTGVCWCNPPYGKSLGAWIAKARDAARLGATVVCLVPARTDTSWWHESVHGIAEVRFLRGRLRFNDRRGPRAPFPTAILIYRPQTRVDPDWATTRQGEPV